MLEDLKPIKKQKQCKAQDLLDSLNESDRKILQDAFEDYDNWPHSVLSKALGKKGLYLADVTIARHRNGDCNCERSVD